jgi:hypothetical protein
VSELFEEMSTEDLEGVAANLVEELKQRREQSA